MPELQAAELLGRMREARLEQVETARPVVVAPAEAVVPAAPRARPAAGAMAPAELGAPFRMLQPTKGLSCRSLPRSRFRFIDYWRQKSFQGLCFRSRNIS